MNPDIPSLAPAPEKGTAGESRKKERRKNRPETDVMLPQEEASRRHEEARLWNLAAGIDEALNQRMILRNIETESEDGPQNARVMEALRNSPITDRREVGEPGVNATEAITVETEFGETVRAYLKPQNGELDLILMADPRTGNNRPYRVIKSLDANGVMQTEYKPFHGRKSNELLNHLEARAGLDDLTRLELADHYGIQPHEMPLNPAEVGLRSIDPGHASRAEYAASAIDRLTGLGVIPNTALREENGTLATVQEAAPGGPPTYEDVVALLEKGPAHPGAKSFMRLACMDYLINSTDRHLNNLFYDPATQTFSGIDNGYSNGYSRTVNIPGPDGRSQPTNVPVDPYHSYPMEIAEIHEDWFLDDEAVNGLKALFDEIKNHLAFLEGKMDPAQAKDLPPRVKEGHAFKALNDTYSLLHERTGPDGKLLEASKKIAKKEVTEFLRRLNSLIVHRRPPKLPQQYHARAGLAAAVE